jgi:hypothetical protein
MDARIVGLYYYYDDILLLPKRRVKRVVFNCFFNSVRLSLSLSLSPEDNNFMTIFTTSWKTQEKGEWFAGFNYSFVSREVSS